MASASAGIAVDEWFLHPLSVHFPIAFWVASAALWVVAVARGSESLWRHGLWMQTVAAGSAVVAVVLGFLASSALNHHAPGHELVHGHRDLMVAATLLSVTLAAGAWSLRIPAMRLRVGGAAGALGLVLLAGIGAHRGAELVYQQGIGVVRAVTAGSDSDGHRHHGNETAEARRCGPTSSPFNAVADKDKTCR